MNRNKSSRISAVHQYFPSKMARISLAVGLFVTFVAGIKFDPDATYHCPPFQSGSFEIHQFQLHPDTATFDSNHCVLWIR